jgi:hypothetical protein
VLDDPEALLKAVLTLAPDYRAARYDYAMALLRRHKYVQAVAELAPTNLDHLLARPGTGISATRGS